MARVAHQIVLAVAVMVIHVHLLLQSIGWRDRTKRQAGSRCR